MTSKHGDIIGVCYKHNAKDNDSIDLELIKLPSILFREDNDKTLKFEKSYDVNKNMMTSYWLLLQTL